MNRISVRFGGEGAALELVGTAACAALAVPGLVLALVLAPVLVPSLVIGLAVQVARNFAR
jgi:hypothetical protein